MSWKKNELTQDIESTQAEWFSQSSSPVQDPTSAGVPEQADAANGSGEGGGADELSSSPETEEKPQTTTTKEYGSNGALEVVNQMLASLLMRKEKGQDLLVWKPKKTTVAEGKSCPPNDVVFLNVEN